MRREPLLNRELEKAKAEETYQELIFSPELEQVGFGNVVPDRLQRSITAVAETFELERVPSPDEVFTAEFLAGDQQCRP